MDITGNFWDTRDHMKGLCKMKSIKYYMKAAERRKILSNRKEFYLDYVCRQTGWDRAKAKAEMDLYLEQGVNYRFYVKKRLWCRTVVETPMLFSSGIPNLMTLALCFSLDMAWSWLMISLQVISVVPFIC